MAAIESVNSAYGLDQANVLMISLDCCRADTFEQASLPYIKSLGEAVTAQTHGDYTLPSHMSMFMGYLPSVQDSSQPYYNPDVRQLWRMSTGRGRSIETVGMRLEGENILDGYRKLGYYTYGTGGVRWFRHNALQSPFDEFDFYGPDDSETVFAPRKPTDFSLNHQPEILAKLEDKEKFFLFINCLETHVPYDTGNEAIDNITQGILDRGAPIWGCKTPSLDAVAVTAEELQSLHARQIAALETVDSKVENLIHHLAKPLLVVILGDHGECFGENMMWGHGRPYPKVMDVPLLITTINE